MTRERKARKKDQPLVPQMLVGNAVVLRPLRLSDRKVSVRWRNDPEIRDSVMGYRFPVTEEMEADWVNAVLKDQTRTRMILAIEDQSDDAFVGFVYLNNIDWFARNAEFGILIGDRGRHGKGLGKEALALVAGYAFDTMNLNRIYLRVVAFNRQAQRLYREFGFITEGIQRQHAFVRGRHYDVVLMGLLRRDFEKNMQRHNR